MSNMNSTINGLKKRWVAAISALLSLLLVGKAKAAEGVVPLYGPPPVLYGPPPVLYGPMFQVTPGDMILKSLPAIGITFLIFVLAPLAGLIWYRKHGGAKKWPGIILGIIAAIFILLIISLIISIFSLS
jgi:hypothetical protein